MTKPTLLTNIKIKNLKPSEQEYTLSDGFNLYLLVNANKKTGLSALFENLK